MFKHLKFQFHSIICTILLRIFLRTNCQVASRYFSCFVHIYHIPVFGGERKQQVITIKKIYTFIGYVCIK